MTIAYGKNNVQNVVYRAPEAGSFDETDPAIDTRIDADTDMAQSKQSRTLRRPRSESLDDKMTGHEHTSRGGDNTSTAVDSYGDNGADLTHGEQLDGIPRTKRTQGRRRSQSCSVPSSSSSSRGIFDTILEEPVGEELHRLLDRDS